MDATFLYGIVAAGCLVIAWLWIAGVFGTIVAAIRSFFRRDESWQSRADMFVLPEGWGERQKDDKPVDEPPSGAG